MVDELTKVIRDARYPSIAPHLRPAPDKQDVAIADAIRAYLASDEVVERAAVAMAAEINFSFSGFGDAAKEKYLRKVRAALSAAGGKTHER